MRKVKILCDGGLGNRLSALIGGLITSDILSSNPVIYWPMNNWCGCEFSDLYESNITVKTEGLNDLFSKNLNDIFLIHENQTNFHLQKTYPQILDSLHNILNLNDDIIYYNSLLTSYCSIDKVTKKLLSLKIKDDILIKVKKFIEENKINKNTIGFHFRKTDFNGDLNHRSNENYCKQLILENKNINFFICSDSTDLEKEFSNFENVKVYHHNNPVLKYTNGDWNDFMIDDQGRRTNFNVDRPRQSVIDAFITLLILSRTTIKSESISTFLNYAKIYSNIVL
jgi:hypothetical protein